MLSPCVCWTVRTLLHLPLDPRLATALFLDVDVSRRDPVLQCCPLRVASSCCRRRLRALDAKRRTRALRRTRIFLRANACPARWPPLLCFHAINRRRWVLYVSSCSPATGLRSCDDAWPSRISMHSKFFVDVDPAGCPRARLRGPRMGTPSPMCVFPSSPPRRRVQRPLRASCKLPECEPPSLWRWDAPPSDPPAPSSTTFRCAGAAASASCSALCDREGEAGGEVGMPRTWHTADCVTGPRRVRVRPRRGACECSFSTFCVDASRMQKLCAPNVVVAVASCKDVCVRAAAQCDHMCVVSISVASIYLSGQSRAPIGGPRLCLMHELRAGPGGRWRAIPGAGADGGLAAREGGLLERGVLELGLRCAEQSPESRRVYRMPWTCMSKCESGRCPSMANRSLQRCVCDRDDDLERLPAGYRPPWQSSGLRCGLGPRPGPRVFSRAVSILLWHVRVGGCAVPISFFPDAQAGQRLLPCIPSPRR